MILRVHDADKVSLTLPRRTSIGEGRQFLLRQGKWIKRKSEQAPKPLTLGKFFGEGAQVWLEPNPQTLTLEFDESVSRLQRFVEAEKISLVLARDEKIEQRLLRECLRLAKASLPRRLKSCEEAAKLWSNRCRVGNQRSRWGSCSSKGTISLNWRIILLPYELGQYVLFHEIIHLEQMNHSLEFWNRLEECVPHAKTMDKELSRVGRNLIRVGHPIRGFA